MFGKQHALQLTLLLFGAPLKGDDSSPIVSSEIVKRFRDKAICKVTESEKAQSTMISRLPSTRRLGDVLIRKQPRLDMVRELLALQMPRK